ncbi:TPA: lpg2541 family Dot/Icm T4SS effector [Legionella pneumophila]|nr:lpg2541 family Dot/Icm T4SS effector [Legionella pneumophila]
MLMEFVDWFLEQISNGKKCILIGENHYSYASEDCLDCILKLQRQGKINKKIVFFDENLAALDNLEPYTQESLSKLNTVEPSLIALIKNNVEVYGLEDNFSNPFKNLKSIKKVTARLKDLGLQIGNRIFNDFEHCLYWACHLYGKSLVRVQRGNEGFCNQILHKMDEDTIVIARVGAKHIPTVRKDGVVIEDGMLQRLGKDMASACFITHFPKNKNYSEQKTYQPESDMFGSYDSIECCMVQKKMIHQPDLTLWAEQDKQRKDANNYKDTKKHCCTIM